MFNVDLPAGLVAEGTKAKTAANVCFLEGPAWHPSGDLYFSDISGNRILKLAPDGAVSVFREDSGRTNGNTFDAQGRLISCEGAEFGAAGGAGWCAATCEPASSKCSPNGSKANATTRRTTSASIRAGGSGSPIPITGPTRPAWRWAARPCTASMAPPCGAWFRSRRSAARTGWRSRPTTSTLYVVDSHNVAGGNRKIWAFDVAADGSLGNQRLVFDFGGGRGGDGMRLDRQGNLWIAAGVLKPRNPHETADVQTGIYVVSPAGKLLGRIPIPEDVLTNLSFAGADFKTLYVTAGKTVFRIEVQVSGYSLWPPRA